MFKKYIGLVLLFSLLSGCGHYGSLYLPKDEQQVAKDTKTTHDAKNIDQK